MSLHKGGFFDRALIRIRLREKMIATFLLFGFLPMLLSSIALQNVVIGDLKRQTEEAGVLSLLRTAQRVEDRMNTYNQIADGIAFDAQLINMLGESYPYLGRSIDLYHYISRLRANIIRANPDVKSVSVYTPHEDLVSAPPYLIRVGDLSELPPFETIRNAQFTPCLSGTKTLSRTGDFWIAPGETADMTVFTINRLITQQNIISRPMAIVAIGIDEGALYGLIQTNIQFTSTLILDAEGKIVSASDRTLIGQAVSAIAPRDVWNRAEGDDVLFEGEGGALKWMSRDLPWGWKVVTLISIDDVQASARRVQVTGLIVTFLCAALAIALVTLVSVKTAGRVKRLLNKFSVSSDGTVDPGGHIEGSDEIALLDEGFREMALSLNQVSRELLESERQKQEATLAALQSRVNPHFLYNALSSIGWMTQTHTPDQVRNSLQQLAAYYRVSLSGGRDVIALKEELEGLNAYLSIQMARACGRVKAALMVDPMLSDIALPKMTLQPIVENCIEHGFDEHHLTVTITITSEVEEETALIRISDDGAGIEPNRLAQILKGSVPSSSGGYGLINVQSRLKLHFGPSYGLHIENLPKGGARVTVRLPLKEV